MHRSKRSLRTTVKVNGVLVEVVTISGLAEIVGKSRKTILRYESTGVFPPALFVIGNYRYYSVTLAKKLVPLVNRLPLHKKPDAELIAEITRTFNEERNKYAS